MIDFERCKAGLPHDTTILADFSNCQYKQCVKCGKKYRFNKDSKGRIDNLRYLKVCIAETCQPTGRTKEVYMKVYHPQYNVSRLCLDNECNENQVCHHRLGVRQELRIDHRVKSDPRFRNNGTTYWDA